MINEILTRPSKEWLAYYKGDLEIKEQSNSLIESNDVIKEIVQALDLD